MIKVLLTSFYKMKKQDCMDIYDVLDVNTLWPIGGLMKYIKSFCFTTCYIFVYVLRCPFIVTEKRYSLRNKNLVQIT